RRRRASGSRVCRRWPRPSPMRFSRLRANEFASCRYASSWRKDVVFRFVAEHSCVPRVGDFSPFSGILWGGQSWPQPARLEIIENGLAVQVLIVGGGNIP